MKLLVRLLALATVLSAISTSTVAGQAVAPKKILVVTVSTRNRFQASIDAGEKMLMRLAAQTHAFTLDFLRQPVEGKPPEPKKPHALKPGASPAEQAKFAEVTKAYAVAEASYIPKQQKFEADLKAELQKLSPESLKNYDAVLFCYTSGNLPIPDLPGFLAWIKAGHAFIGFGNANETMVSFPTYYNMLGGTWKHFKGQQKWIKAEIVNMNPQHPANKGIPARFSIEEFSYKFPNFTLTDPTHTAVLLALDKNPVDQTPGSFPLAWCHDYGQGRVFYTSLGGNQDLWDPAAPNRRNPPETAQIFQTHILNGLLWALGLLQKRPI